MRTVPRIVKPVRAVFLTLLLERLFFQRYQTKYTEEVNLQDAKAVVTIDLAQS